MADPVAFWSDLVVPSLLVGMVCPGIGVLFAVLFRTATRALGG